MINVQWDEKAGTYLDASGQTIPFSKDYWFPAYANKRMRIRELMEEAKYMR